MNTLIQVRRALSIMMTLVGAVSSVHAATVVGRTTGSFNVAGGGSATYNIPVWTPPGVRGLQPNLALSYDSQAGDGLLGVGWSLSGLSAIQRCNKTYVQDGIGGSPQLDANDKFCLGGNRLRATSGTYGADGTVYQTEVADFSKVISHGTAGSGPAWFEVKGREGLTYEYGHTTGTEGSAIVAQGTSSVRVWALSKISDRFGNSMTFAYVNDTTNGSYRPKRISYTFTGSSTSNNNYQVEFQYQSRPSSDQVWSYAIGGKNDELNYLSQIDVESLNSGVWTTVRSYTLNYDTASTTQRLRISSVQECAATDCFAPTTISYQDGQTSWGSEIAQAGSLGLGNAMPLDLNADGIADLIYPDASGNWYYMLGTTSGSYQGPYSTGIANTNYLSAVPIDYNGDGKKDVLVPNTSGNWRVLYFQSAGGTFSAVDTAIAATGAGSGKVIARDINGDGLEDLVYAVSGGTGWGQSDYIYYRLNTTSGLSTTQSTLATLANCAGSSCVPRYKINGTSVFGAVANSFLSNQQTADFNGDGRADFMVLLARCNADMAGQCGNSSNPITYTYRLYVSMSDGTYAPLDFAGFGQAGAAQTVPPLLGDFNGDGCSDIAYTISSGWRVRFGTCYRSGATSVLSAEVTPGIAYAGTYALAMDWDGDGRTDIVQSTTTTPKHWTVLRSTGATFAAPVDLGINYPTSSGTTIVYTADVNGDGQDDLIYGPYTGGSGSLFTRLHNGVIPDLATGFTDALGVSYAPSYVSIARGNYTKGTGATYPEQDYQGASIVVSQVVASNGIGGTYTQSYSYRSARRNLQGRGFEGFATVVVTDTRNSLHQYQYFAQQFPYTAMLTGADLKQPNDSTLMNQWVNTTGVITLDSTAFNQRYFPYVHQSTKRTYEVGGTLNGALITESLTTYTYDNYGNATQITSATTDKDATSPWYGSTWTTQTTNTVTPDTSNWCLGLPTETTVTNTVPGQTVRTRTIDHTVDYVACRVTQDIAEPGSSTLQVTQNYGFDSFGNVNSVGVVGKKPDGTTMPTRTTTMGFGTRGQFAESVTDALSKTSYLTYRYDLGLVASQTDANSVSMSWTYDNFGRLTHEARPDGTSTDVSLANCTAGNSYCGLSASDLRIEQTTIVRDTAGSEFARSYVDIDAFGRIRFRQQERATGGWSVVQKSYDSLGRVARVTVPYYTVYNGQTKYTYDLAGRITLAELQDASNVTDRQTATSYAGRKTVVTDPRGYAWTTTDDVWGNRRLLTDPSPGGTTHFDYDAFNNLVTTTDAASNVSSQGFNIRGMVTSSSDPDRGSWTYTPNSLGEYVSQSDAKSQTVSYTYDALSRPLTRVEPEGTTTWTWGSSASAHNIGRLQSVASPGGYSESYVYDSIGRSQTATYTMDGTSYAYDWSYNSQGLVDFLTYPVSIGTTRLKIKYGYNYGQVTTVTNYTSGAGAVYWTLTATDERMNPIEETLSNNVHVLSDYDPLTGHLNSRTAGNDGPRTNRQNLTFTWDKNENLKTRQNAYQYSTTEEFFYDSMNRLDYSTLNGSTNLDVTLDAIGNITYKSGIGNYTYHATKKHAVASTSNGWSFTYDNNGNMSTGRGQTLTWYSYNLPASITNGSLSSQFYYGANRNLWKQIAQYATGTETTTYIGGLVEKVVSGTLTDFRHTIPAGSATMIWSRRSDGSTKGWFIVADHLGSPSNIMDSTSNGYQKVGLSFDAYGARRYKNWTGVPNSDTWTALADTTRIGFTGHTMVDNLNVIHMKGRVYDPQLGRFLSADPTIDAGLGSQGLNRYSYVGNNPLTRIDPSGFQTQPRCDAQCRDDRNNNRNLAMEQSLLARARVLHDLALAGQLGSQATAAGFACGYCRMARELGLTDQVPPSIHDVAVNFRNQLAAERRAPPRNGTALITEGANLDEVASQQPHKENDSEQHGSVSVWDLLGVSSARAEGGSQDGLIEWESNPDSPFYASPIFTRTFSGTPEEVQVLTTIMFAATGGREVREVLGANDLGLPGGRKTLYDIYSIGPPNNPGEGRIANIRGTNVYYYSPYHYRPGPGVPNSWIRLTFNAPE